MGRNCKFQNVPIIRIPLRNWNLHNVGLELDVFAGLDWDKLYTMHLHFYMRRLLLF